MVGPVDAVGAQVHAARVAQIVPAAVLAPERRQQRAAVGALARRRAFGVLWFGGADCYSDNDIIIIILL